MRKAIVPLLAVITLSAGCEKAPAPTVAKSESVAAPDPQPIKFSQPYEDFLSQNPDQLTLKPLPEWKDNLPEEIEWMLAAVNHRLKSYNEIASKAGSLSASEKQDGLKEAQGIWLLVMRAKTYAENAQVEMPKRKDADQLRLCVVKGEPCIGMPKWALFAALGLPEETRRTRTAEGTTVRNVFKTRSGPVVVHTDGSGVVTAIQD